MRRCLFIFFLLYLIWPSSISSQEPVEQTGILKGKIIDAELKKPISDVTVAVIDHTLQAISDEKGNYVIEDVPVGIVQVSFRRAGYHMFIKQDELVFPGKATYLNVELVESKYQFGEFIIVEAAYFQKKEQEPLSQFNLNQNEIRHAAGSVEDISRVLNIFPSVARVNEISNDLIVRGGSPFENGFYVDGIPIPNINYFQREGGSGGALGIINAHLIEKTDFYTGGFSSTYGDRLSSIVDIQFREGYKEKIISRFDLNLSGFGATVEGPLPGGQGSWIISGMRSYLDLLSNALNVGIAPSFGNIHSKFSLPLDAKNKISVLDIFGGYSLSYELEMALKNNINHIVDFSTVQNTIGLTWQHLWSNKGYMETSISHSFISNTDSAQEVDENLKYLVRDESEQVFTLRNINFIRFSIGYKIEFGFEAKHLRSSFNNYFGSRLDRWGIQVPGYTLEGKFHESIAGFFFSNIINLTGRLRLISGLRGDYFTFNRHFLFSPRVSLSFAASSRFALNFGAGIFHQTLYPSLLARNPNSDKLKDPRAIHIVAGLEYSFNENTKLSFEVYDKEYRKMPLTPEDPELFILDNNVALSGYSSYNQIVDTGAAYSRGLELFFQKRIKNKFYGLLSASLFKSRYRNYMGVWRDRLYDNRIVITIVCRYRPDKEWNFSLRWNFSGGIPYTPLDIEKSWIENKSVLNQEKVLAERYPDYHTLALRADRRFYFKNSSLSIYVSVLNAYNRKNVARYYWDREGKMIKTIYQAFFLPIFGMEYEF